MVVVVVVYNKEQVMDLKITIKNIKEDQAIAFASMLKEMEYCGRAGTTQYVGFMTDGDGNFHPKIETNIPEELIAKYYQYACVFRDGKRTRKTSDPNDKIVENKFPWTGCITLFDYNDFNITEKEKNTLNEKNNSKKTE